MRDFAVIVAYSDTPNDGVMGIGFRGKIPWNRHPKDMAHFLNTTRDTTDPNKINAVIMGRATYESTGKLPRRTNCVITKSDIPGVLTFRSLVECLEFLGKDIGIDKCFVIGGQRLYEEAVRNKYCTEAYVTHIPGVHVADRFWCGLPGEFCLEKKEGIITYYRRFENPNTTDEKRYLGLIKHVRTFGYDIADRTGVGTRAIFGANLRYSVKCINPQETNPRNFVYEFPLFTTKEMYFAGIFWELIWFITGNTDANWLKDRKVKIWNCHTSKEHLENCKLDYKEGEAGPIYGSQWRNWNGEGIDQLQQIVDRLRKNPADRRMVMTAWNPSKIPEMALPPCHMTYTFSAIGGVLNCSVDIRSNDMFLGHPFNVASAALLIVLIGRITGIQPGDVLINISDCHIYKNHFEQVDTQVAREPYRKPLLFIDADLKELSDISELTLDQVKIMKYNRWPKLIGDIAM